MSLHLAVHHYKSEMKGVQDIEVRQNVDIILKNSIAHIHRPRVSLHEHASPEDAFKGKIVPPSGILQL